MKLRSIVLALCLLSLKGFAQSPFSGYENMFTPPLSYVVGYTSEAPVVDGNINDKVWEKAAWTSLFQDIEGNVKPKPYYETKVRMLWDNTYLYIAADMKDPHVWATLTKRDQIVFFDNDFEVFIDPNNTTHRYFEIEINALNNIFDLFISKPYRNGGGALFSWDTPSMLHAVNIQGSLNKSDDTDQGWTVEMAIPFAALTLGNDVKVPKDGEFWRLNFSRVQWETEIVGGKYIKKKDAKGKNLPENNWVWSPQGVIDMHRPERWGYLQFSKTEVSSNLPAFILPYAEKQRNYLWLAYYKQKDFQRKNKRYASSLKELNMNNLKISIDGVSNKLTMHASDKQFYVTISDAKTKSISINDEGLIQ